MINHNRTARGQTDFTLVGRFNLAFDLVTVKQRDTVVLIQLQLALAVGHHLFNKIFGGFIHIRVINQDFTDVFTEVVTQCADNHIAFLINQEGGIAFLRCLFDRTPHLHLVIHIPLQLFCGASHTGGAHNQAHALGNFQAIHGFTDFFTVIAFDAARHATGAWVIRHQHQIAPSQREEGGQGSALVATLFLVYLNNNLLAFLDRAANIRPTGGIAGFFGKVAAGNFFKG